ncbi:hypothetical protein NC651_018207 [Populus alba x Populus x berolinensis]|nr:hypothetical protein NC651_018207 [Populus alba x Populus x berolinensis]
MSSVPTLGVPLLIGVCSLALHLFPGSARNKTVFPSLLLSMNTRLCPKLVPKSSGSMGSLLSLVFSNVADVFTKTLTQQTSSFSYNQIDAYGQARINLRGDVNRKAKKLLAVVNALIHRCYKYPTATIGEVPQSLKKELSDVCRACFSTDAVNKHIDFVRDYKQDFERDLDLESTTSFPATLSELTA